MKLNHAIFRTAAAVLGLAGAVALPASSQAAGFTFNNTLRCNTTPQLNMDPAGNVNITCTDITATTTTPTTAPVCTLSSASIGVGASATLNASCNPAATSYNWGNTSTAGAPAFNPSATSGALMVGPFNTAGTFTYTVVGANSVGPSTAAASGTVTVSASSTPAASTSGCSNGPISGQPVNWPTNSSKAEINLANGQATALVIPPFSQYAILYPLESSSSPLNLTVQWAISPCPGNFSVPATCIAWSTVTGGPVKSWAVVPAIASQVPTACVIDPSAAYYVNMRAIQQDLVTPYNCPGGSCDFWFNRSWQ